MPPRTTVFQTIVALVRQLTAAADVTVTESKGLYCTRLRKLREVDVVIEGRFDGDPVVTSIEVIEWDRKGDAVWVDGLLQKHRSLPTTKLVLVSKSGFTDGAVKAVAAEGGWVEALQPECVDRDGEQVVEKLYAEQFSLTPRACRMKLFRPEQKDLVGLDATDNALIDIYDGEEVFIGPVIRLTQEILALPWLRRRFAESAHDYDDRDSLKSFEVELPIAPCEYLIRNADNDEHYLIVSIHIEGEFAFTQTEMDFTVTKLGDRVFGSGSGLLFGTETVWVGTTDDEREKTTISFKSMAKTTRKANAPAATTDEELLFPALLDLPESGWTDDEDVIDGIGHKGHMPLLVPESVEEETEASGDSEAAG